MKRYLGIAVLLAVVGVSVAEQAATPAPAQPAQPQVYGPVWQSPELAGLRTELAAAVAKLAGLTAATPVDAAAVAAQQGEVDRLRAAVQTKTTAEREAWISAGGGLCPGPGGCGMGPCGGQGNCGQCPNSGVCNGQGPGMGMGGGQGMCRRMGQGGGQGQGMGQGMGPGMGMGMGRGQGMGQGQGQGQQNRRGRGGRGGQGNGGVCPNQAN